MGPLPKNTGNYHEGRTTTDKMPEVRETPVDLWAHTDMHRMRLLDSGRNCENGFDRCYFVGFR